MEKILNFTIIIALLLIAVGYVFQGFILILITLAVYYAIQRNKYLKSTRNHRGGRFD